MLHLIEDSFNDSARVKQAMAKDTALCATVAEMGTTSIASLKDGKKILLCGNGGSASDALHIAAELVGRYLKERVPLPAIALGANSSNLTAIGNDYGFENVFSRQVEALGKKEDVLIALSTSGNSPNVIKAVHTALNKELHVFALTGERSCKLDQTKAHVIHVPSTVTARIQEAHILLGHMLCELIDTAYQETR